MVDSSRAPLGRWAYIKGIVRRYVIYALNTLERLRRRIAYAWLRRSRPRLIAQGDSWFCFPLPSPIDLLQHLQADHGFAVLTLAGAARRSDLMASAPQLAKLRAAVKREKPSAVLLSSGGIEILDLMNARAARPIGTGHAFNAQGPLHLNQADIDPTLDKIEQNIVAIASTALSAGAPHVVLVGYDNLQVAEKPGQTIRDSLDMVGAPIKQHQIICNRLMDQLIAAQRRACARVQGLTYVSLRDQTLPGPNWRDEVHPHSAGYAKGARLIAENLLAKSSH